MTEEENKRVPGVARDSQGQFAEVCSNQSHCMETIVTDQELNISHK